MRKKNLNNVLNKNISVAERARLTTFPIVDNLLPTAAV